MAKRERPYLVIVESKIMERGARTGYSWYITDMTPSQASYLRKKTDYDYDDPYKPEEINYNVISVKELMRMRDKGVLDYNGWRPESVTQAAIALVNQYQR